MHNDDVTPMGFVVFVLKTIFKYEPGDAFELMFKIHNEGKAVVGTYPKSIAQAKQDQTAASAKDAGYPLKTTLEKNDGE